MEKNLDCEVLNLHTQITNTKTTEYNPNVEIDKDTLLIVVSAFEDLRDAYDALYANDDHFICVSAISLFDIVSIVEKISRDYYKSVKILFPVYQNFNVAKINMLNYNPILEKIDHLSSFIIALRFEQHKKSVAAIVEFLLTCSQFYCINHDDVKNINEYVDIVHNNIEVSIVKFK